MLKVWQLRIFLLVAVLPCVGCFGIRHHDPHMQTYEDITDTTIQLTISSDPCSATCEPAPSKYIAEKNEDASLYTQSEIEQVAQHQVIKPPFPRFLPVPTQPVFAERPEYDPPQPMIKFVPVLTEKLNASANTDQSGLKKLTDDQKVRLKNVDQMMNSPGELNLETIDPQPIPAPEGSLPAQDAPRSESDPNRPSVELDVRTVKGTWRAASAAN